MTLLSASADILVITIHGIRTFGKWQERLEALTKSQLPEDSKARFHHYRYGYFSAPAFLVPPLRALVTRRFAQNLLQIINSTARDTKICLFGHSFGTHIVAWGLHQIRNQLSRPIDLVVLSGSVLRPSFPVGDLSSNVKRIVNDCGTRDGILLLSQFAVLFTGAAGRLGLHGFEGDFLRNRYFAFSHSEYFERDGAPDDTFMASYWLPLIISNQPVREADCRELTVVSRAEQFLINNIEPIKLMIWSSPLLLVVGALYALYSESQAHLNTAVARSAGAQATIVLDEEPERLSRAALLAAEGIRRKRTIETDRAARLVLRSQGAKPYFELPPRFRLLGIGDDVVLTTDGASDLNFCLYDIPQRRELWCHATPKKPSGEERVYGQISVGWFDEYGKHLAIYYNTGRTEVYETATGKQIYSASGDVTFCGDDFFAWSPNGISARRIEDGRVLKSLETYVASQYLYCVGSGQLLALSNDGKLSLIDWATLEIKPLDIDVSKSDTALATTRTEDGDLLVVAQTSNRNIALTSAISGEELWRIPVAWSDTGTLRSLSISDKLVFAVGQKLIGVYALETGQEVAKVERGPVFNTVGTYVSDGDVWDHVRAPGRGVLIAAQSKDTSTLRIRDTSDFAELDVIRHPGDVSRVRLSPNAKWLATGFWDGELEDSSTWVWRLPLPGMNKSADVNLDHERVSRVVLSLDDQVILGVNGEPLSEDPALFRWHLDGLPPLTRYPYKYGFYDRRWIEPTSSSAVTVLMAGPSTSLRFQGEGGAILELESDDVKIDTCSYNLMMFESPVLVSNRTHVVFRSSSCTGIVDLRTLKVAPLTISSSATVVPDPSSARFFSIDGQKLQAHSVDDNSETIWEPPEDMECPGVIQELEIDRSGNFAYTLCKVPSHARARARTTTWALVRIGLDRKTDMAFTPVRGNPISLSVSRTGRYVAVGDNGLERTSIFDGKTMKFVRDVNRSRWRMRFLARDADLALVRDNGTTVDVYDVEVGERISTVDRVTAIADSGEFFVVGSPKEGFWPEPTGVADLISRLCEMASRNLTPLEWARYFPTEEYRNTCVDFGKL